MATLQSDYPRNRGGGARPMAQHGHAGSLLSHSFDYTFAAGMVAAADRLEIGVLPAFARPVDMILDGANLNGNFTVGLMSGEVGDPSNTRTVGAELMAATAMTTNTARATGACRAVEPTDKDRSIGITVSADIVAGGTKTVKMTLLYAY
jgi:hypothetical protein